VKSVFKQNFKENIWLIAEVSELKTNASGHCYLELVEKNQQDYITARMRGTIWSYTYRMLKPFFESSTGMEFTSGLKILVNVSVEFHEVYGISVNVKDIDPTYTIGDLARKKLEIIQQLTSEGVIEMNRMLDFPLVPQRVAVISSKTAAGYQDFMNHLENNPYGYFVDTCLFPAVMQGSNAEESIVNALDAVYKSPGHFDIVAIIRGGGSQLDLECFNTYQLAYYITQFPIPVITGIGHEKDDTITDLVAHTRLKTPTATAEYIINCFMHFENIINESANRLTRGCNTLLDKESNKIKNLDLSLNNLVSKRLFSEQKKIIFLTRNVEKSFAMTVVKEKNKLKQYSNEINYKTQSYMLSRKNYLKNIQGKVKNSALNQLVNQKRWISEMGKKAKLLDPVEILKRGYTITSQDGKIVKNSLEVNKEKDLTTFFHDGKITTKF
jgi:exodeoxyribonuclease VII large subunit